MRWFQFSFVFIIFVFFPPSYFAIHDPSRVVTKPPLTREKLSGQNGSTNRNVKSSGVKTSSRYTATTTEKSDNQESTWVFPDDNTQVYDRTREPHKNPGPKFVFPEINDPEDQNWEKGGWVPSQPCPDKATGQFPYPGDCRKFYNCWKGRGILQACAPGTLFNPETLECDFPTKVRCLHSSGYSPVPVTTNNAPDLSDGHHSGKAAYSNRRDKPSQTFQQYTNTGNDKNPPDSRSPSNHAGVQPPNNQQSFYNAPIRPMYFATELPPDMPRQESQFEIHCVEIPANSQQAPMDPYSQQIGYSQTLQSPRNNNQYNPSFNLNAQQPYKNVQQNSYEKHQTGGQTYFEPRIINSKDGNKKLLCYNKIDQSSQPFDKQPSNFQKGSENINPPHNYGQQPFQGSHPQNFPQLFSPNILPSNPNQSPSQPSAGNIYPQEIGSPFSNVNPQYPSQGYNPNPNTGSSSNPQNGFNLYPTTGIYHSPSEQIPSYSQNPYYNSRTGNSQSNPLPGYNPSLSTPQNGFNPYESTGYNPSPSGHNIPPYSQNPRSNFEGENPQPNANFNPSRQNPPNSRNPYPYFYSSNRTYLSNNPNEDSIVFPEDIPPKHETPYNPAGQNTPYYNPNTNYNPSYSSPPGQQKPSETTNPNYNQPSSSQPIPGKNSGSNSHNPTDPHVPNYNTNPNYNPSYNPSKGLPNPMFPANPNYQPSFHPAPGKTPLPATNPSYNPTLNSSSGKNPGNPSFNKPLPPSSPTNQYPHSGIKPNYGGADEFKPDPVPYSPDLDDTTPKTKPNTVPKCPTGYTGLLPHPTNCEKFLNCDHGRTFIQDCGPGTVFNPDISVCDWPSNVDCGKNTGDIPGNNDNENSQNNEDENFNNNQNYQPKSNFLPHYNVEEETSEEFGQESRPLPKWIPGRPNTPNTQVKPNSLDEEVETRIGGKSIKPSKGKGVTPPLEPSSNPEHNNPFATKVELQNNSNNSKNFKHPTFPGHYIVYDFTTTTASTTTKETQTETLPPEEKDIFSSKPNLVALSHIAPMPPITKAPVSRQLVRLRGGEKPSEGFLELQLSTPGWGIVCDKENSWRIQEANIVCKQLGYERGAELTWQGRPSEGDIVALKTIAADSVNCTGKENSLIDCQIEKDNTCDPERDSVWIRCYNNRLSYCRPHETSFDGRCYSLVIPRVDIKDDKSGFSQAEALAHCQVNGGHLLDINSQKENDYISEWLLNKKEVPSIMTAGVGVSLMGRSLWLWEGSADSLNYHNWWPGWGQIRANPPKTFTGRGLCIVAKHQYPCPGSSGVKSNVEPSLCDAEYFFWDAEDCGVMSSKHPYVCERKADKIGCLVGRGEDYRGPANVTETGTACLYWDSDIVLPALQFRISEANRVKLLTKHNYCRNIGGTDSMPWCYVPTSTGLKKEHCDIPPCSVQGTGKSLNEDAFKCDDNHFTCGLNECIPSSWVCDGQPDCKSGLDEAKCTKSLEKFTHYHLAKLEVLIHEKWLHTSSDTCAKKCLGSKSFNCYSFSYNKKTDTCLLSGSNIGLSGQLAENEDDWEYYELTSSSVNCSSLHICDNKKCVNKTMVCDGHNDCGDRSDEKSCTEINKGFQIRLAGGKTQNEGRIEVKVYEEWGVICDDMFGMKDADVVCRELGFTLGAAEVKPHSAYGPSNNSMKYVIDDLNCRGNETSIRECDFNGWGVHDCGAEEVVGVVCKVPGAVCPPNHWQCEGSKECIPVAFLCDNVPDCTSGEDEDKTRCTMGIEVRLVGKGRSAGNSSSGRLEIKRFGIWGTVCDDDFGTKEADVVCKSLGFNGEAEAQKEAAFGAGEGIIWLDQVHCNGSESGIEKCFHHQWGQSNCKHEEDVAVICSKGPTTGKQRLPAQSLAKPSVTHDMDSNILSGNILPSDCGTLDDNLDLFSSDITAKVVAGHEVQKGMFPWQASLRVRTALKSVHWCGAVIISPLHILIAGHCLLDYTKDVYFIRVGDHNTETDEGTEQEAEIEDIYLHERYDIGPQYNNDIALIKLKGRGLQLNSWVRPICLPTSSVKYKPGINCSISGWGSTSPGAGYAIRLQAALVPILSDGECKAENVYGNDALSEGMFCAGTLEGGTDSCQGDSGGPFACMHKDRYTLFGITSWGKSCGRSNKPGVYTRVSLYIDWLRDKLQKSMTGQL